MRPDVSELIASACRVLEDVIGPALTEAYPQEALLDVVRTLRAVQDGWAQVLPFLLWDNRETGALLRRVRAHAAPALAERIDALLAAGSADFPAVGTATAAAAVRSNPVDFADTADPIAAQARNQALRGLLAQIVADTDERTRAARADTVDDILRHLEERARRAPLKLIPGTPRTPANQDT